MICYINRGIVLEQAIRDLIRNYFELLHFDSRYRNFHISVTNDHPFAEMYLHSNLNASDLFPCVIVATSNDNSDNEYQDYIEETTEKLDGEMLAYYVDYSKKAGLHNTIDKESLKTIQETIDNKGYCYAKRTSIRRSENLSIEIWAENTQLKNEIYEQIRLFLDCNLGNKLNELYSDYNIELFPKSVTGSRSNNYNLDFDVVLCGSQISFDAKYSIEQIELDTDKNITDKDIILEVQNEYKKTSARCTRS